MSTPRDRPQSDIRATENPGNGLRILARMIARVHAARNSGVEIQDKARGGRQSVITSHDYGKTRKGVVGNGNEDVS